MHRQRTDTAKPVLLNIALGRTRVGKTALPKSHEIYRELEASSRNLNGDQPKTKGKRK